jgi:hypothetical protein
VTTGVNGVKGSSPEGSRARGAARDSRMSHKVIYLWGILPDVIITWWRCIFCIKIFKNFKLKKNFKNLN